MGAVDELGFDIRGVKPIKGWPSLSSVSEGADDVEVLRTAIQTGRVVLTNDFDFVEPPLENHHGVVIVPNDNQDGDDVKRAVRAITTHYSRDVLSGRVEYVTDWL